jgi:hypothetical protein
MAFACRSRTGPAPTPPLGSSPTPPCPHPSCWPPREQPPHVTPAGTNGPTCAACRRCCRRCSPGCSSAPASPRRSGNCARVPARPVPRRVAWPLLRPCLQLLVCPLCVCFEHTGQPVPGIATKQRTPPALRLTPGPARARPPACCALCPFPQAGARRPRPRGPSARWASGAPPRTFDPVRGGNHPRASPEAHAPLPKGCAAAGAGAPRTSHI